MRLRAEKSRRALVEGHEVELIDTRILPLIETLVQVGADWLAFEVLEGIQAGEVSEEPHEKLRLAQESVRSKKRPIKQRPLEEPSGPPAALLRLDEAQLVWAAAYVSQRLRDSVVMLEQSFERLEAISISSKLRLHDASRQNPITVVLQTGERQTSVIRDSLDESKVGLELAVAIA
jgi:hypothetical protein